MLNLSSDHAALLSNWAALAAPNECCGLIFGSGSMIERLELTDNIAANPQCNFEIEPSVLIQNMKAARSGATQIMGYFHSHPNGLAMPSPRDAAQAAPDGRIWLIITDTELTAWRAVSNGAHHDRFNPVQLLICDASGLAS